MCDIANKMLFLIVGQIVLFSITASSSKPPSLIITPYIKENRIEEVRNLTAVDSSYFLNLTSHSGFVTVDERYNSNIYFWYFPVADKPVNETPWIVWLQGGPGATSIAGLFDEIGPLEYENSELRLRKWTWAKDHSLLFIDNPVGAGYSYTNSEDGFIQDMDTCATHLYKTLREFLILFPELRKAPLYIAGESYAGRYIPALGLKILDQDTSIGALDVQLKGIIMGNPVLNRDVIADYSGVFYQWGLIDSQGVLAVKPLQDAYTMAIRNKESDNAMNLRNKLLDRLQDISMQSQMYNPLQDDLAVKLQSFMEYIGQSPVREAMHVGNIPFTFSNGTVHKKLGPDFLSEVTWKIEKLLEHYRIMIYCGQLDLTAACVPYARARRRGWRWPRRAHFQRAPRTPWWHNDSVAGYVKSGGGFTEVLVRGAGHLVPMDKPAEVQELVSYFIRGVDMPLPPNYISLPADTPEYINIPDQAAPSTGSHKTGMIVSIIVNVLLVVGVLGGVVYFLRWKKRFEAYFYSTVDESTVSGSVLTMT